MSAANANRRFARRAKRQFNPFICARPNMQFPPKPESRESVVEGTNAAPGQPIPPCAAGKILYTEHQTPNTSCPTPDPARRSYVLKRRVGKRTISTYVGAKDGASDIAFIDAIFKQAALHNRHIANELILKLKLMHAENERDFKATETEMAAALTAAGYHRIDRGPWRKVRGNLSVRTPNTKHLTPLLTARVAACRTHMQEIAELYQLTPIRARSKTAARIYTRYAKRALNRLAAAEKCLATVQSIAQRETSNRNGQA